MSSDLSICMVSDDFVPGLTGVGIHVQTICRALVQRGCRVVVVTARHPGQPEVETWNGARICRVASVPVLGYRQALATRKQIRRILEQNSVNVIHYHYLGLLLVQAHYAAKSFGSAIRHLYTYHMPVDLLSEPLPLRPLRGLFRRLHAYYCNRFDIVISPSQGLVDQIRGFNITCRVEVMLNPVETARMQSSVTVAPKEVGYESATFTILYVGRLAPEKNLPLLLNAFSLLRKRLPSAILMLAGVGISRGSLGRLASELKIDDGIRFLGFIDHVALGDLYARCDVLVLPSTLEVQGLVAVEAMRFGKPIVVSNRIAAAEELVSAGENGFIVPPDDPGQLAERLEELALNPGLRQSMGQASRRRAQLYDVDCGIDRLLALYVDVLGHRSAAPVL